MKLQEQRIAVGDLLVGMYVCRLDRDWSGTPFPLQGVAVRSTDDICALSQYAEHVFIDTELGFGPPEMPQRRPLARRPAPKKSIDRLQHRQSYANTTEFEDELPLAREAQGKVAEFASKILDDVRDGREISAEDIRRAVEPMVRSILRNSDAFFWLESLRKRDVYDYSHALNCSALATAFGRHIGFPEDILTDLASGGLLLDVGKLRLTAEPFMRNGPLSEEETAQVRRHVELGLQVIEAGDTVPAHIREMIRTHHERVDGSGYPEGLAGTQIPLLGRIAAVVDSFDAMTSDRSHRKAMSRHAALQELYRARDKSYATDIIEQFMQCLSVYPTGSLVELSNGQVAVVMAQNTARRLRPRVMLLTSPDKVVETEFRMFDLMLQPEGNESGAIEIVGTLEPGAYGLDPADLFL